MNSKYSWYSPLHMVRKLSGILALCAIGVLWTTTAQAQIALITASDGGFESGTSTLAANGWTGVNATSVTWFTGTAAGAATGTKAAFVGSSSTTYIGSTTAVIKHFYRDIAIPSGATQVYLNYKLKMPIIDNNYDYFYIYTNTTAQTPVSGTLPAGTVRATYTTPLLTGFTARPQIDLTALAGTTVRLVFTYKTDGSSPYANPAVDDITLTYVAAPAGCTGTSQYPFSAISAPAPGAGAYTISSAQQLDGEYNQMTGAVAGHTFMSEATAAGTYITVRASTFNGALVSSGTTPLNWTATAGGTYYITYHTNSSCGTSSAYTITKITNTTVASGCTNTSAFGSFAAPAPGAGPYQIATNQYQSEYNTMTGAVAGHTFTSTGSIAGTYITVHAGTYNGTIVAAGTTPLNWTAAAGGSYYIHYNTNSSCGTASTGMTSTITNTTVGSGCTNTTAYGSFTAPAPGAGAYTISSAQYQSEYNTMTGAVAGHTFTSTGSIAGTYITVHAGTYNGTIVAAGTTPLNWTAAAGGSYYIHYNTNSSCGTASTGMTSTITNTTAAANNDLVCDATAVTCGSTTAGTTVGFTTTGTYEGTTTCGVAQSYPGAWYSIVGNGQDMVASLCATSWDSRISIYSGTCTSLVCVGGTDDNGPACSGTSASYGWTSTNGVTYYIKVYGYSSNSTFSLNVTCSSPAPANDACANAINVNAYPYTSAVISNANATDDVPTSTCSGPNKNVWWKVSGVCGTMSAKTCTGLTNFDTEMAVFSGSCGAFTEVTCNDDGGPACSSPQSSVSWTATQGTFYYISVGSYYGSGPTGNLQLNVTVEDGDGDGVGDACDNCVSTSNASQANADGDSAGDACELCDNDPNKLAPGVCGCGVADVPTTYYADDDSDGFGDAGSPLAGYTCIVPSGYVADNSDCDDTQLLYTDNDGDGFGTGSPVACGVADNTDCDDAALLHADVDGDGFGAAANAACGIADNSDCDDTQLLYADNDGDGFGAGTPVACGVADNTDCDDTQNLYADGDGDGFGAGAPVACGVADNSDCNDAQLQYADNDGDGFGAGTPVACGVADNSDCDDTQNLYADTDGDGYGAGAPVACGVDNDDDSCPGDFGIIGSACDAGPGYVLGALDSNCDCVGVLCSEDLTLDITMPAFGTLPTWELLEDATDILVQSGGGGFANPGVNQQFTCLPDGKFRLVMGGVPAGGSYMLRTSGNPGTRIIDNITTVAGTTSVTPYNTTPAALSSNGAVQVPVGPNDLLFTSCDKPFWVSGEYVVCNEDPDVAAEWVPNGPSNVQPTTTGYDFWFYNPNGGYSYIRQRRHNVSDNFANIGSARTCHMKVNNWATANHIPDGVKLNVRVRAVVNNVPSNWGPACRFVRDEALAACPPTKLFDVPGFPQFYSCGVTRQFVNNTANRIYARPVSGANKYKFTFSSGEGTFSRVTNYYYVNLGWSGLPTLTVSATYEVTVQASMNNGASYCVVGDVCLVTIVPTAIGGSQNAALDNNGTAALNLWPNPNNGDVLNMSLHITDPFISTVSMDIFDLSGKRMIARTVAIQDGLINTTIDLNGDLADGMYVVKVTAGDEVFTQRVVIQK